jgi:hypothetical protein
MKTRFGFGLPPSLAATMILSMATAYSAPPEVKSPPDPRPSPTNAIPQSVFIVPTNSKEARDPFFPNSDRLFGGASTTTKKPSTPDVVLFVLNGLSGTADHRLAMINYRTLAEGEESEVTTSAGRLRFRLLEIKVDSVIIEAGGERRELRLRSNN